MNIRTKEITLVSEQVTQCMDITTLVEQAVAESGIQEGFIHIMTKHTTTGLYVNEGLPCVEEDILTHLEVLAPEYGNYVHNRYLPFDGCVGFNANAHIKSMLMGYYLYFPISQGRVLRGARQTMYLVEFDGPKTRTFLIQMIGSSMSKP